MKSIYVITCLVNNKKYIGVSANPNRRFKEHMSKHTSSSIVKDFIVFGKECFTMEIIEENVENYLEKEDFYIQKYKKDGYSLYNVNRGGIEPQLMNGENHPCATITQVQVNQITDLIRFTHFSLKDISLMTEVKYDIVKKINVGTSWNSNQYIYPLRAEKYGYTSQKCDKLKALECKSLLIIKDLKETNLTQKEIAKKHNVARSTVTMINIGKNHRVEGIEYPIR